MNSESRLGRVNADIFRVLTMANNIDAHILRVEAAADLGTARVYVNGKREEFERATGFSKNEIAQKMKIRKVPALRFIVDEGEKNTARVEELLLQIKGEKH